MRYDEACREAGYDHAKPNSVVKTSGKLPEPPQIRNPVVRKALFETRRVVNAIVREYGLPTTIRIEMARDMKLSKKQKELAQKQNKANEKLNKEAEDFLRTKGIKIYASRDDKIKFRLWKECGHTCPYTGTTISQEMLFSSEVDIEHIIPYSRSLDDSYMNKTLCIGSFNKQQKGQRTPYEVFQSNEHKYADVLQRIKALPWAKRRRFEQKEVNMDDFIQRQLNDTRYISVEVKDYLANLLSQNKIEVSKGAATSELRWQWCLDAILNPDGVLEKNRADHRHHAIDAIVIALTTRSVFMKLSHRFEQHFSINPPWETFRNDIKAKIDSVIVSHAATRKISGALHEATAYGSGFVWIKNKKGETVKEQIYVYRRPLDEKFTDKQAKDIRDEKVKALVLARLSEHGNDAKKAFSDLTSKPFYHVDGKTPITSVRVVTRMNPATVHAMRDRDGRDFKHVKYGNNHHVEIIEHIETGKRKGIFVTAMEAARRARIEKVPVIQRDHGATWRFLYSLAINDIVRLTENDPILYRIQKLDPSNYRVNFRDALAATLDDDSGFAQSINVINPIKYRIDAIGRLLTARD